VLPIQNKKKNLSPDIKNIYTYENGLGGKIKGKYSRQIFVVTIFQTRGKSILKAFFRFF